MAKSSGLGDRVDRLQDVRAVQWIIIMNSNPPSLEPTV